MRRARLTCKVDEGVDTFAIDPYTLSQLDLPSISYLHPYRVAINGRALHGKLDEPPSGVQGQMELLIPPMVADIWGVSRRSRATISVSQAPRVASVQYELIEDHKAAKPILEGQEVQPGDVYSLEGDTIKIITGSGYISRETLWKNAEPSNDHSTPKVRSLGHQFGRDDTGGFDRLAGKNNVIREIRDKILLPFNNPDLATEHLGSPLNGVLIYGPEGVGKSTVVKATAEEANATMLPLSATAAADPASIRDVYNKASSQKQRSVISVDPIKDIIPNDGRIDLSARVLQECLDNSQQNEQVITIAVARKPSQLPRSLLRARRLEQKIKIGLPDRQQRAQLFRHFLKGIKAHTDIDYEVLADHTESCTGADIQRLLREAGMQAMIEANTGRDAEITTDNILDIIKARGFP